MRRAFMKPILERVAPRVGATVEFEPRYGFVGRIQFPNGRASFFWDNKFNLNPISSVKVVRDKAYTTFFLRSLGYRTPEEGTFFRERFRAHVGGGGTDEAAAYAAALGYPVFVKPVDLSMGRLVEKVWSEPELRAAAERVFAVSRVMLVQRACPGVDHRLIVLDGRLLRAYERRPLAVVGDGRSTVDDLLAALQRSFEEAGRDTVLPIADPRIDASLARSGAARSTVLDEGATLPLLDVANLSTGGEARDVTGEIHPTLADLAIRVTRDFDLRFAGVDVLTADARAPLGEYTILEINSAPGLDYYTASEADVDAAYEEVLRAVGEGP
ncbi:MAG: hypothetical protein U0414_08510 [Polyangiaceae bacterium]